MNTQILYVLVSSKDDLILEQMWASVYSLRRFHPKEKVIVLVDAPTAKRINEKPSLNDLLTEVKVINVPEHYNNMLRSRYMKTSMRNLIEGNFLYIDTDTIILKPLNEIESLGVRNIAMVEDGHTVFLKSKEYNVNCEKTKYVTGSDISDVKYYFNSGIIYAVDNEQTRNFFLNWHQHWLMSVQNGLFTDQTALACTDKSYNNFIERLPDVYNFQILSYIFPIQAKIVHYFTSQIKIDRYNILLLYDEIHTYDGITEKAARIIINIDKQFHGVRFLLWELKRVSDLVRVRLAIRTRFRNLVKFSGIK